MKLFCTEAHYYTWQAILFGVIDIVVNSVIPILNIADILPAFFAAFGLNA